MPEFARGLDETLKYILMALKALCFWRRPPPVRTVAELVAYTESRAKFVAQTSLYGYIKARAGTRYVSLMEDDAFVKSVNIAKWEIYLACLGDLAAYTAALVCRQRHTPPEESRALAIHLVDTATFGEETPTERPQGFDDIRAAFRARAQAADWTGERSADAAFHASLNALVEWAPIADELKLKDVEIVKNSMRFKWKKVRDQFDAIADADAILTDWRQSARTG